MNSANDAEFSYQSSSDHRRNNNRHALQNRLHGKTHCSSLLRKGICDDCEDRGRSHALPGHCQCQAQKDEWPGWAEEIDYITRGREKDKDKKSAPASEAISNPATGILVDCVKEILCCAKQSDYR